MDADLLTKPVSPSEVRRLGWIINSWPVHTLMHTALVAFDYKKKIKKKPFVPRTKPKTSLRLEPNYHRKIHIPLLIGTKLELK